MHHRMSRRVQKSFDFTKITPGKSQIFFAHKKAIDLTTKTKINLVKANRFKPHGEYEYVKSGYREVGDIKYSIKDYNPNMPIRSKDFRAGLFLRLPITNMAYVRPASQQMLKKINKQKLIIEIVQE